MNKTKKGVFYGWYIVLSGFVIMGSCIGIVNNTMSQFIKPIAESLGCSRASVSMIQTIFSVCHMVFSFLAGYILSRKNFKRFLKIDAFILAASYFSLSLAKSLPTLYISAVITGMSYTVLGAITFSVIISNWFKESRGRAMGMASMGSGVAGMIFNFVAGKCIGQFGWRATFQIQAVCLFVLIAPFVLFVLKMHPSEMGLEPYGSHKESDAASPREDMEGVPYAQALRSPSFWLITFCVAALSFATHCNVVTVSPHLTDVGYSPMFAATMVSACMAALAVGKYSLGVIFDKAGPKNATLMAAGCSLLGSAGMLTAAFRPSLALVLIGASLGAAFGSVAVPLIIQNVFGPRDYASIYGTMSGITGLIGATYPVLTGFVFDTMGSYNPCYGVAVVLSVIGGLVFRSFFAKSEKK